MSLRASTLRGLHWQHKTFHILAVFQHHGTAFAPCFRHIDAKTEIGIGFVDFNLSRTINKPLHSPLNTHHTPTQLHPLLRFERLPFAGQNISFFFASLFFSSLLVVITPKIWRTTLFSPICQMVGQKRDTRTQLMTIGKLFPKR